MKSKNDEKAGWADKLKPAIGFLLLVLLSILISMALNVLPQKCTETMGTTTYTLTHGECAVK